jgi:triosephosphate isomerase
MNYFIANWKQNLSLEEAQKWYDNFNTQPDQNKEIIICPSVAYLSSLAGKGYPLAVQDISPFSEGAHTGRVGAAQIKSWAKYALIGHSEMRSETNESDNSVSAKVKRCLGEGIVPIVCVDLPYLDSQIGVLKNDLLELPEMLFAYEPLAAIGTGKPVDPRHANEIAFKIKSLTKKSIPVLYGGSVSAEDVADYLNTDYVDGVLVGKASLDPVEFAKICQ